jgi:hypothetical protein
MATALIDEKLGGALWIAWFILSAIAMLIHSFISYIEGAANEIIASNFHGPDGRVAAHILTCSEPG